MRLYIAGAMSGQPDFNYPAFFAAAHALRKRGHDAINPADNFNGDQSLPYASYMRQALINLLSVDGVALLPGWDTSKGAQMEVAVAAQLGLPFYDAATGERLRLRFNGITYTHVEDAPPLICVTGKMKSGKSTLADALMAEYGMPRGAFAAALKDGARAMGLTVDGPHKDRECLQRIGTDVVRRYKGADHWVGVFGLRYADMRATGLVVDDCRFPNELAFLKDAGFLTVRLCVSSQTQIQRGANPGTLMHESETALDGVPDSDFDLVIPEDSTVENSVALVWHALAARWVLNVRLPLRP